MSFERIFTSVGVARLADLAFDRSELSMILNVYGRMVAAGKWRDYAIDHRRDRAVFSKSRRVSKRSRAAWYSTSSAEGLLAIGGWALKGEN